MLIDISPDKWILSNDAASMLENAPSLADGLSKELEKVFMHFRLPSSSNAFRNCATSAVR